jgi:hypothetical protein
MHVPPEGLPHLAALLVHVVPPALGCAVVFCAKSSNRAGTETTRRRTLYFMVVLYVTVGVYFTLQIATYFEAIFSIDGLLTV